MAVVLSILIVFCTFSASSSKFAPVVQVQSGKIRGILATLQSGEVVRKYLGIPYAKADRFEPPSWPEPWQNIRNVTSFGKECFQEADSIPFPPDLGLNVDLETMSEDCLNLNVFAPHSSSGAALLPVMFFIHGGSFRFGSSRIYDGSNIASIGKVIVVTINYRLGTFGFLGVGKPVCNLRGNYGLRDQVEALKWVQTNIARFGGDPRNVTIFGHSAGGASVSLLVLSPLANGLFQQAIMQSGVGNAQWAAFPYDDVLKSNRLFAKNIGCPLTTNFKSCLKTKSPMEIVNASVMPNADFAFNAPVIDGFVIPDAPSTLLQKRQFQKRNTLLGVTDDDGTVITNSIPGLSSGLNVANGLNRQLFTGIVSSGGIAELATRTKPPLLAPLSQAVLYRYTDWTNITDPFRNRRMFVDMIGDGAFISPAIVHANAFATSAKTYFYHFQHRQDFIGTFRIASWIKAYHGAEIFFLFGFNFNDPKSVQYARDANFSRAVIQFWANFAKNGDPTIPDFVSWPQYDLDKQQYLSLKPNMEVKSKLRADHVAFWNVFLPSLKSTLPKLCTKPRGDICLLPKAVGRCRARLWRVFFNSVKGRCEWFYYGGCQGNANNFKTQGACFKACRKHIKHGMFPKGGYYKKLKNIRICHLPKVKGPCRARLPRFYFNHWIKQCQLFHYGGCRGNGNNFKTRKQCERSCLQNPMKWI